MPSSGKTDGKTVNGVANNDPPSRGSTHYACVCRTHSDYCVRDIKNGGACTNHVCHNGAVCHPCFVSNPERPLLDSY